MARLLLAVVMVALAGCELPGSGNGCSTVQIDWVDFIQIGSTQYVAGPAAAGAQDADLGDVVSHVKFRVDGNVCDPSYRPKDGDAAFLEPGTPVYQLRGRAVTQAVAAPHGGRILVYEAKSP